MSKTKRQKKNKKYNYHVNRKNLMKKHRNTGTAAVEVPIVKKAWNKEKSIGANLTSMGLAFDVNKSIKIPSAKQPLHSNDSADTGSSECSTQKPSKGHIASELEADAKAPRVSKFELPSSYVVWVTYLLDKYGEDYEAMARDRKNVYQETAAQIRAKIKRFKKIPSQWNAYLESRQQQEQSTEA